MIVPSNALTYGTIGVAATNCLIDLHYAHPIPHGGVSLHWSMHSGIGTAEQALSPFASVILSIAAIGLGVLSHRALTDLKETNRVTKKL
jgi:hypothetical protein